MQQQVLLVDDSKMTRLAGMMLLQEAGFQVTPVESGNEALREFSRQRFDFVLVDIEMPEMDGVETTIRLRALEQDGNQQTPIFAFSAHDRAADLQRFREAGMDGHLCKPFSLNDLNALLESVSHRGSSATQECEAAASQSELQFDLDTLIEMMGGRSAANDIVHLVMGDMKQRIQSLQKSLPAVEREDIKFQAHALVSTARHLQCEQLATLSRSVEQAVIDSDSDEKVSAMASSLIEMLQQVLRKIESRHSEF